MRLLLHASRYGEHMKKRKPKTNLLRWLPCLTKQELETIAFALCTPTKRITATSNAIIFHDRKEVIDALREVYRVYGTAAALATAEILESDP